jgi:hypothetical protein
MDTAFATAPEPLLKQRVEKLYKVTAILRVDRTRGAHDDVWDRRLWTRNDRLSLGRNAMKFSGWKLLALWHWRVAHAAMGKALTAEGFAKTD